MTSSAASGPSNPRLAGLYLRVSVDQDGEERAVTRQLEDCRKKAKALGWTVVDTYNENDTSATTGNRKEYRRMVEDVRSGRINSVVVWHVDRVDPEAA